jgi:hypothetical protein
MISSLSALLDTAKSRLIVTTVACGCVFIDFMTYAHAMPEIERDFDFRFRGGSGAALLVTLVLGAGILAYKSLVGAPEHKTKKEVEAKHKDSLLISEKTLLGLVTPQAATAQDVDVTVFAPPAAAPNEDVLVQVIFHTLDREAEARSRAAKVDEAAMALASIPLTIQVLPNDLIKATLECDGTIISEAIQTTNWNGRLVCLYFSMRLPDVTAETKLRPVLRVFVNGIPAGKVVFKLIVAPNVPNYPFSFAHDTVHAFRRPFLSYASEDRVHVLKAAQLMGALKMKFFQDVLTLSPGDRWERRLYSEIDDCDVFLLFWSQAASASKWVVMEAEYALRRAKTWRREVGRN